MWGGIRGSLSQKSNSDQEKWNHTFVSDNLKAQGLSFGGIETSILNLKIIYILGGLSKVKSSNLDPDEKQHNIIPA